MEGLGPVLELGFPCNPAEGLDVPGSGHHEGPENTNLCPPRWSG
jgi:hypothetical protein